MSTERLIKQILAKREGWVVLDAGLRVKIRRPAEAEMARFDGGLTFDVVSRCVVDWDGFTEADLLGPAIGASDAVPFDAELWAVVAQDHMDWFKPISTALLDAIRTHLGTRADVEKN